MGSAIFFAHANEKVPFRKRLCDILILDRSKLLRLCAQSHSEQAQLSRRRRAMLRIVENFAQSLKVIRSYTTEYGVCKFLLVFHCKHVSILQAYCFSDIQRRIMECL